MKLTIVLLTACFVSASAKVSSQNVSFSGQNVTLERVFSEVKKQTGYVFIYTKDILSGTRLVSLKVKDAPLEAFLQKLLINQPLEYTLDDRTILLSRKHIGSSDQELNLFGTDNLLAARIDVRGRVVNEKGEPAVVSVQVKGTNQGTTSNTNGDFELKGVDENATLVFSGVNVETQEVKVNGRSNLGTITLKTKVAANEEVVVTVNTGYQTLSRERSAGSFSKPDMQIARDRSTSMNILQRIDGLVPGLTVNNAPGARNYVVRGISSIELNSDPLFVVDGVPIPDLTSINPQDVDDITVLKDATAASIWGARAANGVIIITTKKGTNSDKLKIQYDGFVSFNGKPDLDYIPTVDTKEYLQVLRETFDPAAIPYSNLQDNGLSTGIQPAYQYLYDSSRGLLTGAQLNFKFDSLAKLSNRQQINDLFYRNSILTNHTLSLSGGGRVHTFYGSLSYTNTKSSTPTEKNQTFKINVKQDFKFNNIFQAYLITDLTNNRTNAGRPVAADYKAVPYQLFQDADGNPLQVNWMGSLTEENRLNAQAKSKIDLTYTPLNEVNAGFTKGDNWFSRITGGARLNLFKGLRYEGTYSYMHGVNGSRSYDDQSRYMVRAEAVTFTVLPTGSTVPTYYLPVVGGRYTEAALNQRNWTVRNLLVYDNFFGNKHQITFLAGQEAQSQLTVNTSNTVRGYNLNLQTFTPIDYAVLRAGIANPVVPTSSFANQSTFNASPFTRDEIESRFTSYFSNLGYTYDRKYTFNASLRLDKSNLFGLDKSAQNKPVWSIGAKWAVSQESFLTEVDWLNSLFLRATYGLTGNSPGAGSAASYNIFSAGSSVFFPNSTGLSLSTVANNKLGWETTNNLNLGIDFSLLGRRISGSLDYYKRKSFNLLGTMPVNPFTGYATITGNYGDMVNNGIEISLTSENVRAKFFTWTTILNLAYNKNKITKLNNPTAISTGQQLVSSTYATGYSAFSVFAYEYAGLNNIGDPTVRLADKTISSTFAALNPSDIKYMGTFQPVWSGGITNAFQYKGFRLTMNATLNLGHVMRRDVPAFYNNAPSFIDYSGLVAHYSVNSANIGSGFEGGAINPLFLQRWKKPGDEATTNVPGYIANQSILSGRRGANSSYWTLADVNVMSASFIKMRDITLAYNLPNSISRKLRLQGVTLRTQISNLMVWRANNLKIDPEFHFASVGMRTTPVNQGAIAFGLNVNF